MFSQTYHIHLVRKYLKFLSFSIIIGLSQQSITRIMRVDPSLSSAMPADQIGELLRQVPGSLELPYFLNVRMSLPEGARALKRGMLGSPWHTQKTTDGSGEMAYLLSKLENLTTEKQLISHVGIDRRSNTFLYQDVDLGNNDTLQDYSVSPDSPILHFATKEEVEQYGNRPEKGYRGLKIFRTMGQKLQKRYKDIGLILKNYPTTYNLSSVTEPGKSESLYKQEI